MTGYRYPPPPTVLDTLQDIEDLVCWPDCDVESHESHEEHGILAGWEIVWGTTE